MKIMVTGGAGFIGSNLTAHLASLGHDIVVFDNLLSGYIQNIPTTNNVRFVAGDVRDGLAVDEAAQGCEQIYHLAASVGNKRAIEHPLIDSQINVLGTLNILEAARKKGVGKVIVSSSAGVFGELKEIPIDEEHPVEPDTPYGASKLAAEKHSLAYAKLYGFDVICLRYFNVYGPHQRFDAYGNVIPIFVFKMLSGEPITVFGDGEQTRDFVSVHDVVRANVAAGLTEHVSGAFNIGSGSRISINGLVNSLTRAATFAPTVHYEAPRPGDVRDSLANISKARRLLGYEPAVDIEHGLTEYVDWARTELMVRA
jgi:nucleoside-diphosphate-sugar epimerase